MHLAFHCPLRLSQALQLLRALALNPKDTSMYREAGARTSPSTARSASLRRFSSSALSPWLLYVLGAGSSSTSACTCRKMSRL